MWKHGIKYQLCRKLYKRRKDRLCKLISRRAYNALCKEYGYGE